jgi:2-polyprenyl-6-methoxyphenol hydroxylase-like FAD-dependent oxidoreductase
MNVLVVGAGPTGLTLARALAQRGIGHRHVEKAPERSLHSKALGVQARTLEVFERLGIAEKVLATALAVEGAIAHLPGGDAKLDFAKVHRRFPPMVILPQSETERLLLEAGAPPERGVEFVGLDGSAALLRHADGREERATADWIIGCDGAHSAVRHAVGAAFAGDAYPEPVVLADCRIEGLAPGRIHLFPGAEALRVFFPLPDGLWRAVKLPEEDEVPSLAPFLLPGITLGDMCWFSAFRISRRQVARYRLGRVVLAGDAAHIHSPAGGQGMNLGIQDAFALAAALQRGEAAVEIWAAERHRVGRRVLFATDLLTRVMTAHGPLAHFLRPRALRFIARRKRLVRRFEHNLAGLAYPPLPA